MPQVFDQDNTGPAEDIDPTTARLAGIVVCHNVTDPDAAREVISMLGLDGKPMRDADEATADEPPETDASVSAEIVEPALMPADPEWHLKAACLGKDRELWFPIKESAGALVAGSDDPNDPRTICRRCPVCDDCAIDAIKTRDGYGIRAGYRLEDANQRKAFRKKYLPKKTLAPRPERPRVEKTCDCGAVFETSGYHIQCATCRCNLVPSAAAAVAIKRMQAAGLGLRTIAKRADAGLTVVKNIAAGHSENVTRTIADQIVAAAAELEVSA